MRPCKGIRRSKVYWGGEGNLKTQREKKERDAVRSREMLPFDDDEKGEIAHEK